MAEKSHEGPAELALVGDLAENQTSLCESLLEVEPGGECVLYIDSIGGSPYVAIGLASMILLRGLRATGVVVGECSSAALWPFAACRKRLVTPLSVLLFHPIKWQSEENVGLSEAAEWAKHFRQLEGDMDAFLAKLLGTTLEQVHAWSNPGRYVWGPEFASAGLGELVDLEPLSWLQRGKRRG